MSARPLANVLSDYKAHGSSFGEPRWEPQVGLARYTRKWTCRRVVADDNMTLSSSKRGQVGRPFEHEARLKEFLAEQAQLSITSCAGSSRFWQVHDKLHAD